MGEKRFVSMALMALATLTLAGGALAQQTSADASAAKPKITLVEPVKDFGTVPKGKMLDWSFVIKNTGTADLEIKSANPTCGCTVADFDKLIKPGQSGKITAHVDTTNFSGPISKAVTIQSNDPETPAAQVSIAATVKPYVEAYPAGFVRYTLLQGEEQTQSVTLYSEDETPFEILGLRLSATGCCSRGTRASPGRSPTSSPAASTRRPSGRRGGRSNLCDRRFSRPPEWRFLHEPVVLRPAGDDIYRRIPAS